MTSLTYDRGRASGASFSSGLAAALTRLGASFADWMERRRTYRELSRLDERMLKDVGLSRYDVDAIRSSGWRRG